VQEKRPRKWGRVRIYIDVFCWHCLKASLTPLYLSIWVCLGNRAQNKLFVTLPASLFLIFSVRRSLSITLTSSFSRHEQSMIFGSFWTSTRLRSRKRKCAPAHVGLKAVVFWTANGRNGDQLGTLSWWTRSEKGQALNYVLPLQQNSQTPRSAFFTRVYPLSCSHSQGKETSRQVLVV